MTARVMLVDDELISRRYIEQMALWRQGEFALEASVPNAAAALERLARGHIVILLMDVYMPGMNGVELSRVVAERHPEVGMVAISNYDDYDYVRQIMKNGANDYLLKARLNEDTLLAVLRRTRDRVVHEPKQVVRERLAQWLDRQAPEPFPNDGARLGSIVFALWPQDALASLQHEIVVEGVLRLLESLAQAEEDCVAVFRPPTRFVLFVRFYATASMAEIGARMQALCREAAHHVRQMYQFTLRGDVCMPMLENRMLLSYIAHRLEGDAQDVPQTRHIALSIAQHKQLFHVVDDLNVPGTVSLLRKILEDALRTEPTSFPIILREVVEVLSRAADEYGVPFPAPLRGGNLYAWMREHAPQAQIGMLIDMARQMLHKALLASNTQFSPLVRGAMLLLREAYAQPFGLKELACALECSASYLSRLFHQEAGMTVTEYLTQVRIAEAKRLIACNTPLKEVTVKVGFSQYTYFLRVFKQETGMTPKEYLARQQRRQVAETGEK